MSDGAVALAVARLVVGVTVLALSTWAWLLYAGDLRAATRDGDGGDIARTLAWGQLGRESLRLVKQTCLLVAALSGLGVMWMRSAGWPVAWLAEWSEVAQASNLVVLGLFGVTTALDLWVRYRVLRVLER